MNDQSKPTLVRMPYDSFSVDDSGIVTGIVDDSGMSRFEGRVEPDGTFHAKYLRMPGTASGMIAPDGTVTGKSSVYGREIPFSGKLLFKGSENAASAFAGEYEVTYPRPQLPEKKVSPDASAAQRPYPPRGIQPIARRGIKFNLPLDLRTPSYSDGGDCAQMNIETVWDINFWRSFLKRLQEMGYNTLSLWNLNPFPSIVKVPEYPLVALDDVWRTTVAYDDTINGRATNLVQPKHLEHHEVLLHITIDEKIAFWKDVMAYAHLCGIEVYLFFWNIYTFAEQGKYGITHSMDNPVTMDYYRACVRELIRTYPHLAGIGIACGEQMSNDSLRNEQWLWEAYGKGICDGLQDTPDRKFRLIHRLHFADFNMIEQVWKGLPCPMDYSDKYSGAHMLSGTQPPFINSTVRNLPQGRKLWLEVRTDDLYLNRWADMDYIREYLQNMPDDTYIEGFLMGADGYIPAREYLQKDTDFREELFIDRHWLHYALMGRFSMEPDTDNEWVMTLLKARFPSVPENAVCALDEALHTAGKIIPQVSRLYFQNNDAPWYPEACMSHPHMFGYLDIRRWAKSTNAMPGGGCVPIKAYCDALGKGNLLLSGQTPPQVAEVLLQLSDQAEAAVERSRHISVTKLHSRDEKEFLNILDDQQALACLGRFYAHKITAAVHLNLLLNTKDETHRQKSASAMEAALASWKQYAALFHRHYLPQRLPRHGFLDMNALTALVEKDVAIVRNIPIY